MTRVHRSAVQRRALAATAIPLLVCSFAIGCSSETPATTAGNSSTTAAAGATTTTAGGATTTKAATPALPGAVSIKEFKFNPETQTVKVGEKVTWTNEDDLKHFVKSDAGEDINSGDLEQNKTYSATFAKAGTFAYHCEIHKSMKGTITVA